MNKSFYEYGQVVGNLYCSSCCSTFKAHNRKIPDYLLSVKRKKQVCAFIQAIVQKELQPGCRLHRHEYEDTSQTIKISSADEDIRKEVIE